jgi:hypothetical protein
MRMVIVTLLSIFNTRNSDYKKINCCIGISKSISIYVYVDKDMHVCMNISNKYSYIYV